jgi:hypothetical protein
VAHLRGGYAEVMAHGVSGLLVQSQEEAYDAVMRLAGDAALCRRMGEAGRAQALAVHGPEATAREVAFYLAPGF